jgi:hypothetical protein
MSRAFLLLKPVLTGRKEMKDAVSANDPLLINPMDR